MAQIFDITLPMSDALANWPGDAPYRFEWTCRRSAESAVNVGQISMSVHTGTHTDAPFHFTDTGATVDALALDPYIGPARVIDMTGRPIMHPRDLEAVDLTQTPRVLLRTNAWTDHNRFPESIPTMSLDMPVWLASQGIVLIGVDVPSVDALDSKDLPIHHALAAHRIAILESLHLAHVPAGVYELIALPFKLTGADGSPVRAILRDVERSAETATRHQ